MSSLKNGAATRSAMVTSRLQGSFLRPIRSTLRSPSRAAAGPRAAGEQQTARARRKERERVGSYSVLSNTYGSWRKVCEALTRRFGGWRNSEQALGRLLVLFLYE